MKWYTLAVHSQFMLIRCLTLHVCLCSWSVIQWSGEAGRSWTMSLTAILTMNNAYYVFMNIFAAINVCPKLGDVMWYVSIVSTFPNTFALVLDSNLYDLNGTNSDWRCFQQNCHGVIFVQKQKFSEWPETSRRLFLEIIKNTGERIKARGPTPCPRGWGHAPSPWACPLSRGPPGAPPTSTPTLYIPFHGEKN